MGFSSWTWDFAAVEKLQTVATCDCLDPMFPTRIFSQWYICWLSPVSTEWFRLSGHILLSEFHFEKMSQRLKALTSPCFEGASVITQWAQKGPPCSSFPWPNAQRWRNVLWVVTCDCLWELLLSWNRKDLNLGWCSEIPADAWKQLGEARWVNLKKASFMGCLGRKKLLHDGFQFVDLRLCRSWEASDSSELWLPWSYVSHPHLLPMIYLLVVTSFHWVIQIVWSHFAVRVSLWEDVATSTSRLSSPCFEGASMHGQRAQMGPLCSSFPWPNAQR